MWNIFTFEISYAKSTGKMNLSIQFGSFHSTMELLSSSTTDKNKRKLTKSFFPDPKKRKLNNGQNETKSQFIFIRQLVVWICRNLIPYNTGFSSCNLPSWLENNEGPFKGLNDVYICLKNSLAASPDHGTMTTGMWTIIHRISRMFTAGESAIG